MARACPEMSVCELSVPCPRIADCKFSLHSCFFLMEHLEAQHGLETANNIKHTHFCLVGDSWHALKSKEKESKLVSIIVHYVMDLAQ